MGRDLRHDYAGAYHHVMNRGARKQAAFLTDSDRGTMLWLLGRIHHDFGTEIHSYCLMGNHYHLLVRSPEGNISEAMQYLSANYTRLFNWRHGFDGPLFRGRFRSELVESDEYLQTVSRYIHLNPVKAAMCDTPQQYRWSSYRWFVNGGHAPKWLVTDAVRSTYQHDVPRLRHHVESPDAPLGHDFIGVDTAVAEVLANAAPSSRIDVSAGRHLAVLLARELDCGSAEEIAAWYGFSGAATVGVTVHRARRRLTADADFRRLYERALGRLPVVNVGVWRLSG